MSLEHAAEKRTDGRQARADNGDVKLYNRPHNAIDVGPRRINERNSPYLRRSNDTDNTDATTPFYQPCYVPCATSDSDNSQSSQQERCR